MKKLVRFDEGIEVRHLGCMVKRLIHPRTTGSENIGLSVAIVEHGEEIKVHSHGFEEAYFVTEGNALIRIGSEEFNVRAWDAVYVPVNTDHWTLNTGKGRLVLICALSPPPEFND